MMKDGGARNYYGIGYKIIHWQQINGIREYEIISPFYDKFLNINSYLL